MERFKLGQRVVLLRDVEVFPIGQLPAGLTGMVVDVTSGADLLAARVRLDQPVVCLKDRRNELPVWRHVGWGATPDAFAEAEPRRPRGRPKRGAVGSAPAA